MCLREPHHAHHQADQDCATADARDPAEETTSKPMPIPVVTFLDNGFASLRHSSTALW